MKAKSFLTGALRFIIHRKTPELCVFAILLSLAFGYLANYMMVSEDVVKIIAYPGKLFINMLKAIVIFFIIITMIRTPMEIKEVNEAKAMGGITIVYSVLTSILASLTGVLITTVVLNFGNTMVECAGDDFEAKKMEYVKMSLLDSVLRIGQEGFPPNVIAAIVKNNILGVLISFLVVGFIMAKYRDTEGGSVIKKSLDVIYQVVVEIIRLIIFLTPVGVFSLMAGEMSRIKNFCIFHKLLVYILAFAASSITHSLITYPMIFFAVTRSNPITYYKRFGSAIITAFVTASSAASLPLGMEAAKEAGVDPKIVNFVMPLGATMNMDGSSIYYPATLLFIANYYDYSLSTGMKIVLCFVSALVTIGVSPVPSGSIVFLYIVSDAIGLYLPHRMVSLVWAIDPIMDRSLTAINVTGVAFSARVVEVIVNKFNKKAGTKSGLKRYSMKQERIAKLERKLSCSILSQSKRLASRANRRTEVGGGSDGSKKSEKEFWE